MSFTYDPTIADSISMLRLVIQDRDNNSYEFEDEELQYFLTKSGENVTKAAIDICKSLSFKYMSQSSEKISIDDITIQETQNKAKMYLDLAKKLEEDLINGVSLDGEYIAYFGGVYQTDIDSNKESQDVGTITQNNFTKDMFDTF